MQIAICDYCRKKPARRISVMVGRSMDAAGSMDDDVETVDMCIECLCRFTHYMMRFTRGIQAGTVAHKEALAAMGRTKRK